MKLMAIDDNLLDTRKNQQLLFLWKTTARKKRVVSTNCKKYGERRATIQLSRPLTSLWLLSKRISVAAMCVAESSEDFGRVCDSSYSEVPSSDGSSN